MLVYDKHDGKKKGMPRHYKSQGGNWRNRETWAKVANHLGIKKPESEGGPSQDVRLRAWLPGTETSGRKLHTNPSSPALESNTERPDEVKRDQIRLNGNKGSTDLETRCLGSRMLSEAPVTANMGAIKGGDDLNKWYQTKFVPHLEADAAATLSEQGDDTRDLIKSFAFEPAKVGSIKEIF